MAYMKLTDWIAIFSSQNFSLIWGTLIWVWIPFINSLCIIHSWIRNHKSLTKSIILILGFWVWILVLPNSHTYVFLSINLWALDSIIVGEPTEIYSRWLNSKAVVITKSKRCLLVFIFKVLSDSNASYGHFSYYCSIIIRVW